MDVNVKHPWHEQLHQLDGLPLVPCGPKKIPLDSKWQHLSLTPSEISNDTRCKAVGLRCGSDSGVVAFDLDGNTALDRSIAAGCEPYEHGTWIRKRKNAPDRMMVFFSVPVQF